MSMVRHAAEPTSHQEDEHAHPGPRKYVQIAITLAILTAFEVALSYAGLAKILTIIGLFAMAIIKFALVVLWFMHLRFDNKLFSWLFAGGLALALVVFTVVMSIQRVMF